MTFIYILPLLSIFITSYLTKNIVLSVTIGNIATVISILIKNSSFDFFNFFSLLLHGYLKILILDNIMILGFILILSLIVELLMISGASSLYALIIQKKIKTKRHLELTSLAINFLLFIDDYLAAFSLKAFMHPLLDVYKLTRVKFAYFINAQAASLSLLFPLSSWGLMLVGQYTAIHLLYPLNPLYNPIKLLIITVPFIIYPICSIIHAWAISFKSYSYGKMKKHEEEYLENFIDPKNIENSKLEGSWVDFIFPFIIFFTSLFSFCLSNFFYTTKNILTIFEQIPFVTYMFYAILVSYIFSIIYFFKNLSTKKITEFHVNGIYSIQNAMLLLISAWTFASLIKELGTFYIFFSYITKYNIDIFYPLLFFIIAFFSTMMIGSTWAIIALMIPVIGSLNLINPMLFYLTLGSTLSGTIAGSHFTPISDCMLIASASAQCKLFDHYKSHMHYSIAPLIGTIIGYVIGIILIYLEINSILFLGTIPLFFGIFFTLFISYIFNKKSNIALKLK